MRIVIVGGVAAGMSAASRAARQCPSADITVFEAGPVISYAACGLPYAMSGEVDSFGRLIVRTPEQMAERGITVQVGSRAESVDPQARTVAVRLPGGRLSHEPYDRLLLATGAEAVRPSFARGDLRGVHLLRDLPSGEQLGHTLGRARRLCIVGGGYIGLELAEVARSRGLDVVLLERGPEVAGLLDPELRPLVGQALADGGVEVCRQVTVSALLAGGPDARQVTGVRTSGGDVEADAVVVAAGVRPRTELAQQAGVSLGGSGAVRVNARQETDVDGIYAAGDNTEAQHLVSGRGVHIPLALTANRMGRVAGVNMAGGDATFPGIVGTGIFRTFGLGVAVTGLTQTQAEQLGLQARSVTVHSTDIAGYMHGARPLHFRLTGEVGSGRLLGAQVVAEEMHAAKRVDVVAALLGVGASVCDLFESDLAYAPPFSSTWDVPLVAADRLLRELARA